VIDMMNKWRNKVNFGRYHSSSLGSNLLNFYNFKFSEALAFGFGEGLYFRFYKNGEKWNIESYNLNLVDDLCANLTFFINHFVAYSPVELLDQIKENLYVKRYPFLIVFDVPASNLDLVFGGQTDENQDSSEAKKLSQKVLVYGYDPNDDSVIINNGVRHFGKISSRQFLNLFTEEGTSFEKIEWRIYIPPRRIVKTSYIIRQILYRNSHCMLNLQVDNSNYFGVAGIEKFFNVIKSPDTNCKDIQRLLNSIISHETMNGYYRDLFAEFLAEVHTKYKNNNVLPLIKSYRQLASLWKELFLNLNNNKFERPKEADEKLMEEILRLELINLKILQKISLI
jgi:hypothetical protein